MGKLFDYAEQDKLNKEIAEGTNRLYLDGMSYKEAFLKAKNIFQKEGGKHEKTLSDEK